MRLSTDSDILFSSPSLQNCTTALLSGSKQRLKCYSLSETPSEMALVLLCLSIAPINPVSTPQASMLVIVPFYLIQAALKAEIRNLRPLSRRLNNSDSLLLLALRDVPRMQEAEDQGRRYLSRQPSQVVLQAVLGRQTRVFFLSDSKFLKTVTKSTNG